MNSITKSTNDGKNDIVIHLTWDQESKIVSAIPIFFEAVMSDEHGCVFLHGNEIITLKPIFETLQQHFDISSTPGCPFKDIYPTRSFDDNGVHLRLPKGDVVGVNKILSVRILSDVVTLS